MADSAMEDAAGGVVSTGFPPAGESTSESGSSPRRTAARVHFISAEKVRFTDSDLSYRSKVLLFSERTPGLAFDSHSAYPFPHFHIPTREEIWEANRAQARQAAREAGSGSRQPGTPQGRKRKNLGLAGAAAATTPPDLARRSSRSQRSTAAADTEAADDVEDDDDDEDEEEADDTAAEGGTEEGGDDSKANSDVDESIGDDRSSIGSISQAPPVVVVAPPVVVPKRRGRPPGTKNKPRDPDLALEFEMRQEEERAGAPAGTERLTQRQRAMLLQESGEAPDDQLVSLPNRPLKSKSTVQPSEEQLARKQAANERRKLNERERMEKEKTDIIQKLLTNTPAKRGEKATAAAAEKVLGAIPKAARIRAVKKGKGGEPGDEDDPDGEGDEPEEEEVAPTAEEDEAAARERKIQAKYNRNKILTRQYIELVAKSGEDDGAGQSHMAVDGDRSSSAAGASAAAASSVPIAALLRCEVSFPAAAPLPPAPIFSFATNVAHLTAYKRSLPKPDVEAAEDDAESAMEVEVDTPAPIAPTPAPPAAASSSSSSSSVRVPRPNCCRPGCPNQRRYTDARSQLPICSLDCLKQVQPTDRHAPDAKPDQPTAA